MMFANKDINGTWVIRVMVVLWTSVLIYPHQRGGHLIDIFVYSLVFMNSHVVLEAKRPSYSHISVSGDKCKQSFSVKIEIFKWSLV